MTVHHFPSTLPNRDQLVLPQAKASECAHKASTDVLDAANKIMAANDARDFAEAIDAMHRTLDEHCRGFAALRKATLEWWKPTK